MGGFVAAAAPFIVKTIGSALIGGAVSRVLAPKPPTVAALPPPPPPPPPPVPQAAPARVEPPGLDTEVVRRQRAAVKRALPRGRRATILTSPTGVEEQGGTTLLGG